jgi:RNA polymerase sigma-70 factor (ECF subfamily)
VAAYGRLVQRHQAAAWRVAVAVAGHSPDVEDVIQNAFVKAWHALPRFRPDASFRPWVLRIVANEARNLGRSAGRRQHLHLRVAVAPGMAADDASADDVIEARERSEQLARALSLLDQRDRLVLAYRYFAELSEAEMAVALDCSPGTVKSRLSRARDRLRSALGADPRAFSEVGG